MRKMTTTEQLLETITNNFLHIEKAELHYKFPSRVEDLNKDDFRESLEFLAESIFSDMVDWHYERKRNGEYIFDSGRQNGYSDFFITAYLRVGDGVKCEDVEKVLLIEETEE